jgi:hypothetical protein
MTVDVRTPGESVRIVATGFLTVSDAVRLGYLRRDDAAVPGLHQLLAGPDPWCPFFF